MTEVEVLWNNGEPRDVDPLGMVLVGAVLAVILLAVAAVLLGG